MKKALLYLTLFGLSFGPFLNGTTLFQDMAEQQKLLIEKRKRAYQPYGEDGLNWRFYKTNNGKVELDLSGLKNPSVMILPQDPNDSRLTGLYYFRQNGQNIDNGQWWSRRNKAVFNFEIETRKNDSLFIDSKIPDIYVWAAEKETINEIWEQFFVSNKKLFSKKWNQLLAEQKITKSVFFNDLKVIKGQEFPLDPSELALSYASKSKGSLKAKINELASKVRCWEEAEKIRELYLKDCELADLEGKLKLIRQENVQIALSDIQQKFPVHKLSSSDEIWVKEIHNNRETILEKLKTGTKEAIDEGKFFVDRYRRIMLANPLLNDLELLAIRRNVGFLDLRDHMVKLGYEGRDFPYNDKGSALGAPSLSTHSILPTLGFKKDNWDNEIIKISNLQGEVKTEVLYNTPEGKYLISNAKAHWDGKRVAFTMGSYDDEMSLFEIDTESLEVNQISPDSKDHFVDCCYLPDGNIVVMSTAIMTSLPCEGGSHMLANMYLLNPHTKTLRQLGLDQENSYHATVQEDGRVMYVRYEYADTPHYYSRVLMNMNPDGTNQREKYGSNSVWPTSFFYPQQVPGKPNLFTAVVSGHHGQSHMGQLMLFNTEKGRREADGAIQFIGSKDKPIEAHMVDQLYGDLWPKHMYSFPLDQDYHITMAKLGPFEPWGLYLVDTFDNMTLIYQPQESFIAWPQILNKRPLPPVIPNRVRDDEKSSTVYIQDIYEGPGLDGIPKGTVKEIAVYALHYGYQKAATHNYIGIEGPWDARYMLGTAPVNEDGSAIFKIPAMMPIALMPLDSEGQAVQKMRSWINPQPGEVLSCIGCHETMDHAPLNKATLASRMQPQELTPWFGEQRPYSFVNEVQPTLDRYCIGCHDGTERENGETLFSLKNNFSLEEMLNSKKYSQSYKKLQKYVRRNGPESDYALMTPMDLHASSSKLIQMLKKGHHGVELDDEAWRRLYMWIDLNVPFHAAYHPKSYKKYGDQSKWRQKNLVKYAGLDWNPEEEYSELITKNANRIIESVNPKEILQKPTLPNLEGWPFSNRKLKIETQTISFGSTDREVKTWDENRSITRKVSEKAQLEFVKIPAGRYVMGSTQGYPNETPSIVEIDRGFWMSTTEITNEQFQAFDSNHDSRFADIPEKDQTARGVALHRSNQPAVRVSHKQAIEFCKWLSKETGKTVKLPSEEQWEWAARGGSADEMWYGSPESDFSRFANLSDRAHRYHPLFTRRRAPDYFLWVDDVDDGQAVSAPVKSYEPNSWGLFDMIGNVEEWTSSTYTNDNDPKTWVVKGGSWFDIPHDARAATRWGYNENVRLPDLGFRVIIEE